MEVGDYLQFTTTKLVTLGLCNPSASVPRNGHPNVDRVNAFLSGPRKIVSDTTILRHITLSKLYFNSLLDDVKY